MTHQLQESFNTLERRVEYRTAELKHATLVADTAAEQIGQENILYQPFVQRIIKLAQEFQLDRIEIFLQKSLSSP